MVKCLCLQTQRKHITNMVNHTWRHACHPFTHLVFPNTNLWSGRECLDGLDHGMTFIFRLSRCGKSCISRDPELWVETLVKAFWVWLGQDGMVGLIDITMVSQHRHFFFTVLKFIKYFPRFLFTCFCVRSLFFATFLAKICLSLPTHYPWAVAFRMGKSEHLHVCTSQDLSFLHADFMWFRFTLSSYIHKQSC